MHSLSNSNRRRGWSTPAIWTLAIVCLSGGTRAQQWAPAPGGSPAPARSDHAVVTDTGSAQVVLFGGRDATGTALGDTWVFDGATWQPRAAGGPAARWGHAMAFDAARSETLLFGGSVGSRETWLWNGTVWRQATPATSPPGRRAARLAHDSARGVSILFGGLDDNGQPLADTWSWDGTDWTAHAGNAPPPRHGAVVVDDAARARVLLHGGTDGGGRALADTWLWDGSGWQPTLPSDPPRATGHAAAYDPLLQRVVLLGDATHGGGTWSWDGTEWARLSSLATPPPRAAGAAAYDPANAAVLIVGGADAAGRPLDDSWWFGAVHPHAAATQYGTGCPLAQPLTIDAAGGSVPSLGTTFDGEVRGIPATAPGALISLGVSRSVFAGLPLPLDLGLIGMPGCRLYHSSELTVLATGNTSGVGRWSLPIPTNTGLLGRAVHAQAWAAASGATPAGWITSGGLTLHVGMPPPVTLVHSDFTGTAPGANTPWTATKVLAPQVSFGGVALGGGAVGDAGIHNAFGFSISAGSNPSTLTEALAQNHYASFSLGASGPPLDLGEAQIEFAVQRRSFHAPRAFVVMTSVGGYAAGAEVLTSPTLDNGDMGVHRFTAVLPRTGYASISSIEVRIYCVGARYGGHAVALSDLVVTVGVPAFSLTLTAGAGGGLTASPTQALYGANAAVTVQATPAPGFRFAGFGGALRGSANPGVLAMRRDTAVSATFAPLPAAKMSIGTNLDTLADWSSAFVFQDIFQRAHPWKSKNQNGTGPNNTGWGPWTPVDAQGWPTQAPFVPAPGVLPQIPLSVVFRANEAGPYRFFYQGTGTLELQHEATFTMLPTGGARTYDFTTTAARAIVAFFIHATNPPPNHLRDFRLVQHGMLPTYASARFHPQFLAQLAPFSHLRFMNWMRTNGSIVQRWDQRTRTDSYTQARDEGVAPEVMIELSNLLGVDAWICIPHAADDDYVRQTARLWRDTFDPRQRLFVEYSNETWNPGAAFSQTTYVQDQGQLLGLDPVRWNAGQKFTGMRSAEIFAIFEQEYGSAASQRLVKVLATQSANTDITEQRLAALRDPRLNPSGALPDALAIAPYFGETLTPASIPPLAPSYPTVSHLLDVVAPQTIATQQADVLAQKAIADVQGLELICYEAGQHFVGINGAEGDAVLTGILHQVNRDPRMYTRYTEYLDMLLATGVGHASHFHFCGTWDEYGSWGMLEYIDQPRSAAPKYRAVTDWIATH